MSKPYARNFDQMPNDLASLGATELLDGLKGEFTDITWSPRIRFAGLLDVPDSSGETVAQGPVVGLGADLLSAGSIEPEVLNLSQAIVSGRMPTRTSEMLMTDDLARRLDINLGQTVTIITTTMFGSLTSFNLTVAGTIRFGVAAMDRGLVVADINDIRGDLDMMDAAGEIVGFFDDGRYWPDRAEQIMTTFNESVASDADEFVPVMMTLMEHSGLEPTLKMYHYVSSTLVSIFVVAMSIVLWNAGLLGSIRRYGEFGIRLAIGETQGHLYRFLIAESALIGLLGSVIGTLLGLLLSWYLQEVGIDVSSFMKNASIVMSDVLRAQVTTNSYFIGLVPGLVATLLGSMVSGLGIYSRQTSQLAKEFEA
jgi:putative ABC transport system permease protein